MLRRYVALLLLRHVAVHVVGGVMVWGEVVRVDEMGYGGQGEIDFHAVKRPHIFHDYKINDISK